MHNTDLGIQLNANVNDVVLAETSLCRVGHHAIDDDLDLVLATCSL